MTHISQISILIWLLSVPGCQDVFSQKESSLDSIAPEYTKESQLIEVQPQIIRNAPLWMHEGWFGSWELHEGFNANVDLGVRVGWGKYNPWKGASFFTNLNALYAIPLDKSHRWNAAFGGYYSNFKMWGDRKNAIGLMGMVDYQINDRLNAGIYATHDFGLPGDKSFSRSPMPWLENPATTVGANLGIKVNESLKFNISMSFTRYHSQENDFPSLPSQRPELSPRGRTDKGKNIYK